MEHTDIHIIPAEQADAPLIAGAICDALGYELVESLAGNKSAEDVKTMFANLASRDDSQYSYLNTLKAVSSDATPMGFLVAYDGGRLYELREAFYEECQRTLDKDMCGRMGDETAPGEFYLDSLAVLPEWRGRGVATALIEAMALRAAEAGLPLGLLCDKSNARARRLYEDLGFVTVGEAPFAGELMNHMQRTVSAPSL